MKRIAVIGCTGSGKTTMAAHLAERLGLSHIELDSIYHQPNWEHLEPDEFREAVLAATQAAQSGWSMCGGYETVIGEIRDSQADTFVWLDLPRHVVMAQVIRRTLRRLVHREVLWNGNRENPWGLLSPKIDDNIILWAWATFGTRRREYEAKLQNGTWDGIEVFRLESRQAVGEFLASYE